MSRLPAGLEVSAFLRRAEQSGGFGAVIHRGDADRGSILLLVQQRGQAIAVLERLLAADGDYRWQKSSGAVESDSQRLADFLARRRKFDPDLWVIELDIAPAERFIAEIIAEG